MADFTNLRAANVFRNRPFGMPDIDNSSVAQMLSQIVPLVSNLKDDDLLRQKELMQFEQSLANQRPTAAPIPTRGPNAIKKQHIVQYAPPTSMQQQFAREEAEARDQKFRMGALQAQQSGALNNALATGAQRSAADMARLAAEINARKEEGAADRTSREAIAKTGRETAAEERKAQRTFTAQENQKNRDQRGLQIVNVPDPSDPTGAKQIAVKVDLSSGKAEPITHEGQNVTNATKLGTKPNIQATNLKDIRSKTQDALNEIDEILDPKTDKLTSKGSRAVGGTSIFNWIPTTEGFAGNKSIQRIKSQQVLNLIADMKAQSKTGATGFGNMSNKDLAVLENAATKLDTGLDESEFEKEMKRIRDTLRKVMQDQSTPAEPDRPGTISIGKKPRLDPDELLKKYGG